MFWFVIPFWKSFDEIWFTYKIPENLKEKIREGQIVEISFWKEKMIWLLYETFEKIPEKIDESKIKEIISIVSEKIFLNYYRIELLKFISKNYFTPIHNSLSLFFPRNLIEKIKKWKLEIKTSEYNYFSDENKVLTKAQEKIFEEIIRSEENKFLLFWVTGSWKTEIYIKLIEENLKNWKQSLLLIPEIILTNQISERLKKYFWNDLIILNSTVSEAKKTKYFLDIFENKAKIIIWTRSALFYPFADLWLIIIDEEHDNSYISDQTPRYNSIEIANKITDLVWNKLLLASWTPSINSMYKAISWNYKLLNLLEKFK